jgi:thioesterase domain-containing protein
MTALVLLRKGKGADAPLFLVHPVGGNVLCYGELVRRLGGEEPVHGFQSAGLSGMPPHTSLEEMAAHYLGLLKGVQPRGPYRLGGWSMGGVIAFEMARRLTEEGSEVERLALFDSLPPGYPESEGEEDDVRLLFGLAHDLAGLTGRSVPLSRADLEGKSADEGLALLLERARQAGAIAPWFGMNMAAQLWRVYQANVRALLAYRPATPFPGRVSLWTASENPWRDSLGPRLGWEAFAAGGVEVELIPADHYGLLREPAVLELARQLGDQLRDQPRDPAH